ncbi:amino acid/amide ABC transporter membrane protein 2 (HAAT family) [Anaerobacterium chartisolvens]|uniref:Amino acid/amide ABC transporter membrane protein 2 (HAAT family) n=1 Tax=Anaerobacterium chartisolvens TaxID=1297424 RepID=A0A369B6R3_9FIRM|nr:branched-chain amino acid ABC transporter permease [Anaerobacterium chartisolvens]RCX17193.1 amino acid/amide ABC transporter membrane protein 2 (HAAT family) [Anaerobacterium chartisolvens]
MKNLLTPKNIKTVVGIVAIYGIIQLLISTNILSDYYQVTLAMICINIILAVGLNLITGFTGQFSLGHAGFMSIGAYTSALITINMTGEYSFYVGILGGAGLAAVVGFIIGMPTLRLKGDYLAIATLGMAEIIRIMMLNLDFTGGAAGLSGIPQYTNWLWLFVFSAGTVLVTRNFINSSHGRACISIREDEIASEAMGVNTTKYKVLAFVIGAFFAGIAGALYSSYFYFIKPDLFGFLKSIDILVIVVLGGMGSLTGSILAAILLAIISTYLQSFPELRMVIYSLLLVIIMIFRPKGLMGSKEFSLGGFPGNLSLPWKKSAKVKDEG